MYINRQINSKTIIILSVSLIIIAIALAPTMLDYNVNTLHGGYDLTSPSGIQQFQDYTNWFTLLMASFGILVALILLAVYYKSPIGKILFGTIISSTAIILFSGFEDCMYFILGNHVFPPESTNWVWMWQSKTSLFGYYWVSSRQIEWTLFWMVIVLPIIIYVGIKL